MSQVHWIWWRNFPVAFGPYVAHLDANWEGLSAATEYFQF